MTFNFLKVFMGSKSLRRSMVILDFTALLLKKTSASTSKNGEVMNNGSSDITKQYIFFL